MALSCGLVGLPNVGKSTLFNLLLQEDLAASGNFPFCTIDPQASQTIVTDSRLGSLSNLSKSQKTVPAMLTVTDIAGLVQGASKGEGLGNMFLQNIRSVDAIVHVVRLFQDSDITHVVGNVNPARDLNIINNELILADLLFLEKRLDAIKKQRFSKDEKIRLEDDFMRESMDLLQSGQLVSQGSWTPAQKELDAYKFLLTTKPIMVVCNVSLDQIAGFETLPETEQLRKEVGPNVSLIPISVSFEKEVAELEPGDRADFLAESGVKEDARSRVILEAYKLLGHISFFTSGAKETRAWSMSQGGTSVEAAAKIHSDIARGFIVAEVVSYDDFCAYGGWSGAKDAGKLRQEGKEYIVQDGDVILFRFNV